MSKRFVSAIVAAAGSATRMGGEKQRLLLHGMPVLAHTLTVFQQAPAIDEIVVVARAADVDEFADWKNQYGITKLTRVVCGGDTRQQSVKNGLAAISAAATMIAVHDGARPLITAEQIETVIEATESVGAAAAAAPVKDTVKMVDLNGVVESTPDRSRLWAVHTPQIFDRALYETAMQKAEDAGRDFTDDCQLFEFAGLTVQLVNAGYRNLKITTPEDMDMARALMKGEEPMLRIGHGYDVHRLTEGRALILGGVNIPYEKGLLGHSDADVLTHAVMDALLGAAALGDIGHLFPDTDETYRGADSVRLLQRVVEVLCENGYAPSNIDATVLAQAPKLAPHIETMRKILANACNLPFDAVSVKATTEEKLGFTGAGEGIAAHAVCLVKKL